LSLFFTGVLVVLVPNGRSLLLSNVAQMVAVGTASLLGVFFFFYLVSEAIGPAAIPGLLCQPQVIEKMIVEKQLECRLAGETEVLGENLP
jgi:hypothetical protein